MPESPDIAVEIRRQAVRLTVADKVGRTRRNINAILSAMVGPQAIIGFANQIQYLEQQRRLDPEIARLMRDFGALRNAIEYRGRVVSEDEWRDERRDYVRIERWAHAKGYALGLDLQNIE